jgi:phosphoenolpyruvate carboxykinase (ATP)
VLDAKSTWADPAAYEQTARLLSARFAANFKPFEPYVSDAVKAAGIHAVV